ICRSGNGDSSRNGLLSPRRDEGIAAGRGQRGPCRRAEMRLAMVVEVRRCAGAAKGQSGADSRLAFRKNIAAARKLPCDRREQPIRIADARLYAVNERSLRGAFEPQAIAVVA